MAAEPQVSGDATTQELLERLQEITGVEKDRLSTILRDNLPEFLEGKSPLSILSKHLREEWDVVPLSGTDIDNINYVISLLVDSLRGARSTGPGTGAPDPQPERTGPPPDPADGIVRLVDESGEELRWPTAPPLARVLERAARINRGRDEGRKGFDVSFSSVLLALLAGGDPFSTLFQRFVRQRGSLYSDLLRKLGANSKLLADAARASDSTAQGQATYRVTSSGQALLEAAQKLQSKAGSDDTEDVRGLLAALIYEPGSHEGELDSLGIPRRELSEAFLDHVSVWDRPEQEYWRRTHEKVFKAPAPPPIEKGPSAFVATDIWTLKDTLGYRAYAHAIARFMTHDRTVAPLTLSIQAPWGGGKTSLMRMIQKELDPNALKEVNAESALPRGALTVREALDEVGKVRQVGDRGANPPLPEPSEVIRDGEGRAGAGGEPGVRPRMTVWFNAWKYESTNQVWSGLADAIMQQVAARLDLHRRERFWLELNIRRVDADRIRKRVYEQILRRWWQGGACWRCASSRLPHSLLPGSSSSGFRDSRPAGTLRRTSASRRSPRRWQPGRSSSATSLRWKRSPRP
jgi:hypothetical protein